MSGFENDPIMLDDFNDDFEDFEPSISPRKKDSSSRETVPPSDDLNDEEFELVKERFAALLPKYGALWRQMLPTPPEQQQQKESSSPYPNTTTTSTTST